MTEAPDRVLPPWPYYTAKHAARLLGVDAEFLSGLANQRSSLGPVLRMVKSGTTKGNWVPLYAKEDIDALREEMR